MTAVAVMNYTRFTAVTRYRRDTAFVLLLLMLLLLMLLVMMLRTVSHRVRQLIERPRVLVFGAVDRHIDRLDFVVTLSVPGFSTVPGRTAGVVARFASTVAAMTMLLGGLGIVMMVTLQRVVVAAVGRR